MKYLLILFLLPIGVFAQTSKQLTPTGAIMRVSPSTTLTGGAEQNMYSDTIPMNTQQRFNKIRFAVKANITTGINLTNLTLRFVNGANTVTLLSALSLSLSMANKPLIITGEITNQGNGNAMIYIVVAQDGTMLNAASTYTAVRRIWAIDFLADQPIQIKSTVAGLGVSGTTIGIDEIETQGF